MKRNRANALVTAVLLILLTLAGCAAPGSEGRTEAQGSSPESPIPDVAPEPDAPPEAGAGPEAEPKPEAILVPDFEMTLLDGSTVSFADYRGKKVLLNFWATWCGPCVGELPAFQHLTEEYPEELAVLAVNCSEDQTTVQKFNDGKGYTFPIVLDTDGRIQYMFGGITSIPVTVVIDEEGYIVTASRGAADADTMYEVYKDALGF